MVVGAIDDPSTNDAGGTSVSFTPHDVWVKQDSPIGQSLEDPLGQGRSHEEA